MYIITVAHKINQPILYAGYMLVMYKMLQEALSVKILKK